jgi:Fe-S cluster assembly protein SufD
MISDGLFVYVPDNTVLAEPIEALFYSSPSEMPAVSYPRNLYLLGRGAKATVIETFLGDHDRRYLTNCASEIVLQANASLEHIKVGIEGPSAYHVATIQVDQARDSRFISRSFSFGGALVRNDINSNLNESGAECDFQGLYLATGTQHVDNHTAIDHRVAHCKSREVYKGVLSAKSEGVFNGKVYVRKDAQKTIAEQSNKNLLLSPDATINTKPQLEIFADDVRCTHGATIGQLDAESIFYLRSRGLSDEQARAVLVRAFAHEVIDGLANEEMQTRLGQLLETHLAGEKE